jgi:two-component system nitrate/nitrite response regulator NarL
MSDHPADSQPGRALLKCSGNRTRTSPAVRHATRPPPASTSSDRPAVAPLTVLVADDSELFRCSIARTVQSRPQLQLVGEASEGQAALELIRALRPRVAIVDLRMPGLDGEQVVAHLADEGIGTRVLLLTAHLTGTLAERALAAGAAGCCSKDDSEERIVQAIHAAATGRTGISIERVARSQAPAAEVRLSAREQEVLKLASQGHSAKQIAFALYLSRDTVHTLLHRANRKLGTTGTTHAVAEAIRCGLL